MSLRTTRLIKALSVVILMVFMPLATFASPATYWTLNSSKVNYRHFIQIRHENGVFKAIELDQRKGDYPRILASHQFYKKILLEKFLGHYMARKNNESSKIENWPIEEDVDYSYKNKIKNSSSHQKLFGFGHRNKNLWAVTHQWNKKWEEKYAKWIEKNVKEDFFEKYGISTDCADAVLGVRWIFSRINGLPVANHISATDSLFTNYSVPRNFRKLPKSEKWFNDELFRAALSYVMDLSSTRTLKIDAYPVALTKKGLSAGAIILTESKESNHAKLISENHYNDPTELPLFTLASTVPRKVRLLVREVVTDQGWPEKNEKSFLRYRWAVSHDGRISLKGATSHPDYSLEQFSDGLQEEHPIFIKFLLGRLKESYDPQHLISIAIEDIVDYIKQRIKVVNEGAAFCSRHDCSLGSDNWGNWSTPSRDKKLKAKFSNIDLLTSQFEVLAPGLMEKWIDAQVKTRVSILEYSLSLKTIRYLMESGKASSDPALSVEQRWGIDLHGNVDELVTSTLDLLAKRKDIIESQNESCSPEDCYPKTTKWLMWNTFKIDEQLLGKYQEYQEFCQIYGAENCFYVIANKSITFNSGTEILGLKKWIDRIPFFYSNLDVSKQRRWGKLEKGNSPQILKYEKSITFSDVSSALVDGEKLINLNTGKDIYVAPKTEHPYLAKNGEVLIKSDQGNFHVFQPTLGESSQIKTKLKSFSLIDDMSSKIIHFESTGNIKVVIFSSKDGFKTYALIYNSQGKVLYGPTLALNSEDRSLIFLPKNKKLISLKENIILDLSPYSKSLHTLNMKNQNLTPVAMDKQKVLFNYYDEDLGITYPALFKKNKIIPLGVRETHNVTLKSFNLSNEIFFLEDLVSEEYPQALVTTIINNHPKYEKVGNTFSQVRKDGEIYYFSTLTGSAWDQEVIPQFYKLNDGLISKYSGAGEATKFKMSHLGKEGYFTDGKDVYTRGAFRRFDGVPSSQQVVFPSFSRADEELCKNTYANDNEYIEQFSYQHGDYSCFGSIYSDESKEKVLFSLKFRTDMNIFNNLINYQNHRLEFLGPNLLIWWSKYYN